MSKIICENTSKSLSGKYRPAMLVSCENPLDHAKQSATDILKTAPKWEIQKTAEAIGDLSGNKIAKKLQTS